MDEFISREVAIAYIREQSEECQKAFEELGGESGIYAGAYNDLAEDFYSIPPADVAPVVHGRWVSVAGKRDRICSRCLHNEPYKNADDDAEVFEFCPHCGAKMDGKEVAK